MKLFRPKIASLSDEDLIGKYKKSGQNYYVGELYKRYSHLVFGVSLKYLKDPDDASDAVLQIFEKLLEDLKKHEIENFKSWLHTVTRNHCLMHLRKMQTKLKKVNAYKNEMEDEMHTSWQPEPESVSEKVKKEEKIELLEQGIKTLKQEQKECIELFFLKEKCYKEIAEDTGYTLKKVKSYIQNGKRNLKIYMKEAVKKSAYS